MCNLKLVPWSRRNAVKAELLAHKPPLTVIAQLFTAVLLRDDPAKEIPSSESTETASEDDQPEQTEETAEKEDCGKLVEGPKPGE